MNQEIISIKSIETLINSLDPEVKNFLEYGNVMKAVKLNESEINPYCFWSNDFYTRNLVEKTKAYELIVLCWNPGQYSPIHNHQGQDCWMYIAKGKIDETQYVVQNQNQNDVVLKETRKAHYRKGQVGYIHDDIGVHIIKNNSKEKAISIHLYSNPIHFCKIYDPEKGKVSEKHLSYYSIKGKKS